MEVHSYYFDQEGKTIEYEGISSHIGIAIQFLNDNPEIKEEFEKSKIRYPTDFLVENKGFIQVTDGSGNGYYRNKIVFSASLMRPVQKRIIMGLIEEGYKPENIDFSANSVVKKYHEFMD